MIVAIAGWVKNGGMMVVAVAESELMAAFLLLISPGRRPSSDG